MTAEQVIAVLGLERHPEGGWYRETYRDQPDGPGRGAATAIYYLLRQQERSHWHRIDAVETWHFYAGAPLVLELANASGRSSVVLGSELLSGQRPQATVSAGEWQAARPLGDWSLVGCTVAPAFQFAGFELAPPGWEPE